MEEFLDEDFVFVLRKSHSNHLSMDLITKMVLINKSVRECCIKEGGPFEFNLRDLLRWADAIEKVYLFE